MSGGEPAANAGTTDAGTTDGRLLRAERTRQVVVESFLDLVGEGELQPTATASAAATPVATAINQNRFIFSSIRGTLPGRFSSCLTG